MKELNTGNEVRTVEIDCYILGSVNQGTLNGGSIFFKSLHIYRVSHELRSPLRESVPYVKLYRYNPKHLCPKLNGYGDNGQRSLKL